MGIEPMRTVDAAWLHMDRPTNLMVVNTLVWTECPLDEAALLEVLHQRLLQRFRRFTQRVQDPTVTAGALSGPQWVDDPEFTLERHVHVAPLPAPGDEAALQLVISQIASGPMRADRPLWELHVLTGYGPGSALLLRIHHAIADGVALMQVVLSITDPVAAAEHAGALPVRYDDVRNLPFGALAAAAPGMTRAVGWVGDAAGAFSSQVLAALTDPHSVRELTGLARSDAAMLHKLGFGLAVERNRLQGPLVADKHLTWTRPAPLAQVKDVGRVTGRTVNDVMLAVIAGAFRRYFGEHESQVGEVVVIVPMNLRAAKAPLPSGLGNEFGLVFVPLPIGETDQKHRDARIKEAMDKIKTSREGVFVYTMLQVMGQIPRGMQHAWIDAFSGKATAVVTNINGPDHEVRLAGVAVGGAMTWVPGTGPVGLGLSIFSYAGQVAVGLASDAHLMPDPDLFLALLNDELDQLRRSD